MQTINRNVLVVWDFDKSLLIAANSDPYIVRAFSEQVYEDVLKRPVKNDRNAQWTDQMCRAFVELHSQGVSVENMREKLCELPLENDVLVKALFERGARQIVLSDANTLFIEWLLQKHNLAHCFEAIISNPAHVSDAGVLIARHYHRNDTCSMCPVNLCKGRALDEYIASAALTKGVPNVIAYVGDGGGDLHPCLRDGCLRFARDGYALAKALQERDLPRTTWKGAEDLRENMMKQLYGGE